MNRSCIYRTCPKPRWAKEYDDEIGQPDVPATTSTLDVCRDGRWYRRRRRGHPRYDQWFVWKAPTRKAIKTMNREKHQRAVKALLTEAAALAELGERLPVLQHIYEALGHMAALAKQPRHVDGWAGGYLGEGFELNIHEDHAERTVRAVAGDVGTVPKPRLRVRYSCHFFGGVAPDEQ